MKHHVRVLMTVLVVALLVATVAFSVGCAKKDEAKVDPPAAPTEPAAPAEEPPYEEVPVATANDSEEGEAVLSGACTQCHDATRILVQPEMTDWVGLVNKMEQVHGAVLTAEQKDAVIKYLEERNPTRGEEVISGKCTTCHDASRIFAQPSGTQWESVLETMIDVHKAELTEEEQAAVLDYLENR